MGRNCEPRAKFDQFYAQTLVDKFLASSCNPHTKIDSEACSSKSFQYTTKRFFLIFGSQTSGIQLTTWRAGPELEATPVIPTPSAAAAVDHTNHRQQPVHIADVTAPWWRVTAWTNSRRLTGTRSSILVSSIFICNKKKKICTFYYIDSNRILE